MRMIGRNAERWELKQCERSAKSELVCVYGRRRVGKTFLVEQTFGDSFAFRATGVEKGTTKQQLRAFFQRLKEHGDATATIPKDWFEAFARLDKILSAPAVRRSPYGKRIVFLDEFPWFATKRSDFLMAFGEFWNRRGTQDGDYVFVICGSATSWIIQNVLDDTGSLFHRVTCQIHLSPFSLSDAEKFFRDRDFDWSREQILEAQMVFGGLPFFYDLMDGDESFRQNLDRLLFRPHALLRGESNRLLEATLKKSPVYGEILEKLSHHVYGMKKSACREELGIPYGTFTRAVDDLVKCGYVAEFKSRGEDGNPLYIQMVDSFLIFHYHFLNGEHDFSSYDELVGNMGLYTNWRGHAFEIVCMHHESQIKKALGIGGVNTRSYPWMNPGEEESVQIDLVIERDDRITNILEMKCTERPFVMTRKAEENLLKKREVFRKRTGTANALKIVLVSASGVQGTAHMEHISRVLVLDDLFEA